MQNKNKLMWTKIKKMSTHVHDSKELNQKKQECTSNCKPSQKKPDTSRPLINPLHCATIPTGGTAVNKLPTMKYYEVRQFATNQLTGWQQLPLVRKLPEQETKEGDTPDEAVLESQQQEQTEF